MGKRRFTSAGNVFELVRKTGEIAVASASVIDHRTRRIANAGLSPSARDRKEFTRMGQEKVEAAAESIQAMAMQMLRMQQELAASAFRQALNGTLAAWSLWGAATPAAFFQAQAQLARSLVSGAQSSRATAMAHLVSSAAKGLHPIHFRATANARRLKKIR